MCELADYEGKRVELEIDGKRIRGRVVRGPGRRHVLLEEKGTAGADDTGVHCRLGMLRIWRHRQLVEARVVKELPNDKPVPKPRRRRRKPDWTEAVEVASGDPENPPEHWKKGQLAWAEAVYNARRQVDRGRKAMIKALKQAAS